jgi:hypothetical protein
MKKRLTKSVPDANSMINLDSKGHVTVDTPFYHLFEADVCVMNIVMATLPSIMPTEGDADSALLHSQLLACSMELLNMVVKYSTNDPLLIRLYVNTSKPVLGKLICLLLSRRSCLTI